MKRLGGAALISTLHWFETELLTREDNFVGLMAVNREVLAQAEMPTRTGRIVLDMNLSGRPPDTHRCPPCAASSTAGRPD